MSDNILKENQEGIYKTLIRYSERALELKERLWFKPYMIYGKEEAERYIQETKEYEFIIKMFHDMHIYNWEHISTL